MHDRTPAAAAELAAVDSGHPDPNGLRQEPRVVLSFTPVISAVHLVAETTKTTIAAALLVAAGQNSGELTWPSQLATNPPPTDADSGPQGLVKANQPRVNAGLAPGH